MGKFEEKYFWPALFIALSIVAFIALIAIILVHWVFIGLFLPIAFSFWLYFRMHQMIKNQKGK